MQAHELEWTPERIRAFWDHFSAIPSHSDRYFSRIYGRSLIAYVAGRVPIGIPLDYGCGRGDLLAYLIDAGCTEVHGVDQSAESRSAAAEATMDRRAQVIINPTPRPESVNTAFMVEVVEHMNDAALESALREIHAALLPRGHLVITTPNDEDLQANSVMCPECHAVFHVMQHVRSWNPSTLSRAIEAFGFETLSAKATILSPYAGLTDKLWRTAKLMLGAVPNLIYIGRKI
jgi:SAM-dependent methyltransferase